MQLLLRERFKLIAVIFSFFITLIVLHSCVNNLILQQRNDNDCQCSPPDYGIEEKNFPPQHQATGQSQSAAAFLRNHPVIFIGGYERSGTTLMRAMIDAHPDVRCGAETRVIPDVLYWLSSEYELSELRNSGVPWRILADAIAAFMSEVIMKHGEPARRYCNKDPTIMRTANFVGELFPKSKFIFMIRDGRAAVHSAISKNYSVDGFDTVDYETRLIQWNHAVGKMWQECQQLGPLRCLPVWYEMLVLNPRKVIRKVIDFLDLPWSELVLHHHELVGKPGGVHISETEWSTDQVVKPLNNDSLKKFVDNLPASVEQSLISIAPMIANFGYDLSPDPEYTKIAIPFDYYKLFYEKS